MRDVPLGDGEPRRHRRALSGADGSPAGDAVSDGPRSRPRRRSDRAGDVDRQGAEGEMGPEGRDGGEVDAIAGERAQAATDEDEKGEVGVVNVGSISKKWDVYVDPYFLRNVILVGRKGSSFLESGYVYAPYVPLQVTPTIFGTEDFVPRKGVMTRYAKKMVKPDLYGLVIIRGLLGESGGI